MWKLFYSIELKSNVICNIKTATVYGKLRTLNIKEHSVQSSSFLTHSFWQAHFRCKSWYDIPYHPQLVARSQQPLMQVSCPIHHAIVAWLEDAARLNVWICFGSACTRQIPAIRLKTGRQWETGWTKEVRVFERWPKINQIENVDVGWLKCNRVIVER